MCSSSELSLPAHVAAWSSVPPRPKRPERTLPAPPTFRTTISRAATAESFVDERDVFLEERIERSSQEGWDPITEDVLGPCYASIPAESTEDELSWDEIIADTESHLLAARPTWSAMLADDTEAEDFDRLSCVPEADTPNDTWTDCDVDSATTLPSAPIPLTSPRREMVQNLAGPAAGSGVPRETLSPFVSDADVWVTSSVNPSRTQAIVTGAVSLVTTVSATALLLVVATHEPDVSAMRSVAARGVITTPIVAANPTEASTTPTAQRSARALPTPQPAGATKGTLSIAVAGQPCHLWIDGRSMGVVGGAQLSLAIGEHQIACSSAAGARARTVVVSEHAGAFIRFVTSPTERGAQ